MDVTVEEVTMWAYRDRYKPKEQRKVVRPNMWRVRVDGMHAGFLRRKDDGVYPGAKLVMHLRFPDDEMAEIEEKVSAHFKQKVDSVQPTLMVDTEQNDNDSEDLIDDLEDM